MEGLTPPLLHALREVKWLLSSGKPMKEAFQNYLERTHDPLAGLLREYWILKWQSGRMQTQPKPLPTYYQKAFWNLVERGCAGQPTLDALTELETEVTMACELELDEHLATLPFKVLIPLLLFQFPAYLLLLLGPLLRELGRQLGG